MISAMTTVEEIEKAVVQLTSAELKRFRDWFEAFDGERFDEKIEEDAKAGKLDRLADEALAEFRSGHAREFCGISQAADFGSAMIVCR